MRPAGIRLPGNVAHDRVPAAFTVHVAGSYRTPEYDEKSPVHLAFTDPSGQRRAYVGGGQVRIAEEAAKADARIAYTPATRAYGCTVKYASP